jgi:hypothetical protein
MVLSVSMELHSKKIRLTAILMVGTVVLASMLPASQEGVRPTDVNGDSLVDIFDVQAIVADLLTRMPAAEADVNKDGQVDIFDLQVAVAEASETTPTTEAPKESPVPDTGILPRVELPPVQAPSISRLAKIIEDDVQSLWNQGHEEFFQPLPETARYLFRLTSHAPPAFA